MYIFELIGDLRDMLCDAFTPEAYEDMAGRDYRFKSIIGFLVRPILWLLPFILPLIPVGWVAGCIISKMGILDIILFTVFGSLYVLLLAVLIVVILCMIESFAKNIACLIQYGELPMGAENPVDFLICATFRGLFYQ